MTGLPLRRFAPQRFFAAKKCGRRKAVRGAGSEKNLRVFAAFRPSGDGDKGKTVFRRFSVRAEEGISDGQGRETGGKNYPLSVDIFRNY